MFTKEGKYDLGVNRTENEIIATINAPMNWLVFIKEHDLIMITTIIIIRRANVSFKISWLDFLEGLPLFPIFSDLQMTVF